jgi:hypothetical protein
MGGCKKPCQPMAHHLHQAADNCSSGQWTRYTQTEDSLSFLRNSNTETSPELLNPLHIFTPYLPKTRVSRPSTSAYKNRFSNKNFLHISALCLLHVSDYINNIRWKAKILKYITDTINQCSFGIKDVSVSYSFIFILLGRRWKLKVSIIYSTFNIIVNIIYICYINHATFSKDVNWWQDKHKVKLFSFYLHQTWYKQSFRKFLRITVNKKIASIFPV